MAGVFELQAEDRGLREFMTRGGGADLAARMSIQPAVSELVRRAQDSGALRSDIGVGDVPLIPMMVGAVINGADDVSPGLLRRILAVVVDGLSAYAPAASPPAEPPASATVLCPSNGSNGTPAEPWEKQRQSRKLHTSATEGL